MRQRHGPSSAVLHTTCTRATCFVDCKAWYTYAHARVTRARAACMHAQPQPRVAPHRSPCLLPSRPRAPSPALLFALQLNAGAAYAPKLQRLQQCADKVSRAGGWRGGGRPGAQAPRRRAIGGGGGGGRRALHVYLEARLPAADPQRCRLSHKSRQAGGGCSQLAWPGLSCRCMPLPLPPCAACTPRPDPHTHTYTFAVRRGG